jgi:hypothetical protein
MTICAEALVAAAKTVAAASTAARCLGDLRRAPAVKLDREPTGMVFAADLPPFG